MGPACLKRARERRVEEQKAKVSSDLFPCIIIIYLSSCSSRQSSTSLQVETESEEKKAKRFNNIGF